MCIMCVLTLGVLHSRKVQRTCVFNLFRDSKLSRAIRSSPYVTDKVNFSANFAPSAFSTHPVRKKQG